MCRLTLQIATRRCFVMVPTRLRYVLVFISVVASAHPDSVENDTVNLLTDEIVNLTGMRNDSVALEHRQDVRPTLDVTAMGGTTTPRIVLLSPIFAPISVKTPSTSLDTLSRTEPPPTRVVSTHAATMMSPMFDFFPTRLPNESKSISNHTDGVSSVITDSTLISYADPNSTMFKRVKNLFGNKTVSISVYCDEFSTEYIVCIHSKTMYSEWRECDRVSDTIDTVYLRYKETT